MLIAPSMLSSDFSKLGEETIRMERAGADWITELDLRCAHCRGNPALYQTAV